MPASNQKPSTPGNGIFYALPLTGFKIDVQVLETEKIPGPYSDYAEEYLGLSDVIAIRNTRYEIMDVDIKSFTRPDPDQIYFIEYNETAFKDDKSLTMAMSEGGLIIGANDIKEPLKPGKVSLESTESYDDISDLFTIAAGNNQYEKIDTVVRRINIDTMTIEKDFFRSSWQQKSTAQKAQEAVEFMERIKENRFLLISGYQEVNYGQSIEYMDQQLKDLYDDYLSLFTGVKITRTHHYSFIFIPEAKKEAISAVAFKFSGSRGVFGPGESTGDNVFIRITPSGITDAVKDFVDGKKTADPDKTGFYYRIPEYADIAIVYDGEQLYQTNLPVNQMGMVSTAPKFDPKIIFHQNTGSIKSIRIK